jgi:hypothetical protein
MSRPSSSRAAPRVAAGQTGAYTMPAREEMAAAICFLKADVASDIGGDTLSANTGS